jgi:hypothetical protein
LKYTRSHDVYEFHFCSFTLSLNPAVSIKGKFVVATDTSQSEISCS